MVKKSKVLALLMCIAMLVVTMPLMAYAEDPVSPISITDISVEDDTDVVHVTVEYTTEESVGDQLTILATITSFEVDVDEETGAATNVAYIDQFDKEDAEGEITFDVSKTFLGQADLLYVKMGGFNVATAASGQEPIEDEGVVILYGDVSGNGVVDATDAGLVLEYFAGLTTEFANPNALIAADVSGNGVIDATDAGLILEYFAGLIPKFPVEN